MFYQLLPRNIAVVVLLPCWVSVQGKISEQTAPIRQYWDNLRQFLCSARILFLTFLYSCFLLRAM
jgi:hypothetical protein